MKDGEHSFSFKGLFSPLTTFKAIHIFIIVGLIVFFNMLFNVFVWDDKVFILLYSGVHSINLIKLFEPSLYNSIHFYRPLAATYFSILYSVFTTNVFFYHLFQLAFHILNTILLYLLFKRFLNKYVSLFLSLIFLVHPMQVESVSYISQTATPLSFLFGMSALLLLFKKPNYSIVVVDLLLLLSILTKESGFVFLLSANYYIFMYKEINRMKFLLSSFFVLLIYLLTRFTIGSGLFGHESLITFIVYPQIARSSILVRLQTIPAIIFYYIKTFIYPASLAIDQNWVVSFPNLWNFYLPLLVDVIIFAGFFAFGIYCFKYRKTFFKTYLFFAILFLFSLGIVSQIIPLDMTVADRWFYFPMAGILGMIGIIYREFIHDKLLKKLSLIFVIGFLLLLGIRTIVRNTNWQDAIGLYTHDIKISDNFNIEDILGQEYLASSQYNKAYIHLQKSIKFYPQWEQSWNNLGVYYQDTGDMKDAIRAYSVAIKNNSGLYSAYENLGRVYLLSNNLRDEQVFLTKVAFVKYPNNSFLYGLKGITDYRQGKKQKAIAEIQKSYTLSRDKSYLLIISQMRSGEKL